MEAAGIGNLPVPGEFIGDLGALFVGLQADVFSDQAVNRLLAVIRKLEPDGVLHAVIPQAAAVVPQRIIIDRRDGAHMGILLSIMVYAPVKLTLCSRPRPCSVNRQCAPCPPSASPVLG